MKVQATKADTEISPGVTMAWLMEGAIAPYASVSLARMTVDVATTSEAHKHDNCTEVIHCFPARSSSVVAMIGSA